MSRRRASRLLAALFPLAATLTAGGARADTPSPPLPEWLPTHGAPHWLDLGEIALGIALVLVVAGMLRYRGALRRARAAGEARFRILVQAAPYGVVVHRQGQVLFVNDSARRTLRLPNGSPLTARVPEALLRPESPAPPGLPADGGLVHLALADGAGVDVRAITIDSEFDRRPARLTFIRDMSTELAAQRALAESRDRLEMALEAVRDGIWEVDLETGRLTVSPAFGWVMTPGGVPPADLAGWRALVHPADRARLEAVIADHQRNVTPAYECEMRIRRADGSEAWVLEHGRVATRDDLGRPRRLAGTVRDITARKRAEQRLEMRGRLAAVFLTARGDDLRSSLGTLLQEILEAPCSCVGMFDATGRLRLACNDFTADGAAPEHSLLSPDAVPEALRRVLGSAGPLILTETGAETPRAPLLGVRLGSGERVLGLVAVGGRAAGYQHADAETLAGIAADLEPLIQSLLEAEAKDALLAQAQKMEALGVLAGGIAHDFNNILQAILGFSALARQDAGDPERLTADLDRVQRATVRGRDLVQRILQFSRPSEPEAPPLDPVPLTEGLVRELRAGLSGRIRLVSRLEADCGRVRAAPQVLRQALVNLTTNAVQAMEATGGTITVAARPWTVPTDDHRFPPDWCGREVVEFSVADTGPGIPEEHRARLFDPFFTTREVGQGSGLGLSVVHGLVSGLGGHVTIECPAAGGTLAAIYLPRVRASGHAATSDQPPAFPAATEGALRGRILFVDDDPEIRDLAVVLLSRAGFDVETAPDGLVACKRITDRPDDFDIVVTDQYMPGLTGRELALRVAALRPALPVILVSGLDEPADPSVAGGLVFREVVTKPFFGQSLCLAVHRALTTGPGGSGGPGGGQAGRVPLDTDG